MATCPKCHHDVAPGASFCGSCGTAVVAVRPEGEPLDPFIGQTFKGTYFIEMHIGGGGMGDVYRARHVTLDVPFALKILKRALLHDPAIVQRFHREARAASQLRHPNIVNVTDFGQTEDGTLYMVMEYVAGRSLARVIAEEFPLSEQRVVHVGQQVLSALAEAHANRVLHRDLKPENVMLEPRRNEPDVAKVLDFGIAKIQVPGERGATLTQAGLVCGTPGYMSPEQWSGEELDARSDLYSVGVILYEMLTRRLPFEAQTPMELVRKHLTEQVVPPSRLRDGAAVSPDLEGLVLRALSVAREDRPASAEVMRDDLLACVLSPERALGSQELDAQRTVVLPRRTPAGQEASRATPSAAATVPIAGAAAGRRGSTPAPRAQTPPRATPAPPRRHEMDEDGEANPLQAPPRRRSRVPLVAGAVAAAVAVLGGGAYFATRGRGEGSALAKRAQEAAERRADEEAKQRAEEGARRQAEEDARRRAEEDARRRAEEDARRRAEEDARRRAEEDARRRADAGARRRAEEPRKRRLPRQGRFDSRSKLYSFPLPHAADGKGVLSINAEPPGGSVFLDDVGYGSAPCEILVPAGSYRVRVKFKGGEQSKELRVRAGTREMWTAIFIAE
jgi:hypothetical protein